MDRVSWIWTSAVVLAAAVSAVADGAPGPTLNVQQGSAEVADGGEIDSSRGVRVSPSAALLSQLQRRVPIQVQAMPLADGVLVDLDLKPVLLNVPTVTMIASDGTRLYQLPSPDVRAFSGTVDGEPDSRVFLGWDGGRLHGWVQTHRGLDVIAAEPGRVDSWLYRIDGSGAAAPVRQTVEVQRKQSLPVNEYTRILQDLSIASELPDRESGQRPDLTSEEWLVLVNRAAGGDDDDDEDETVLGACCVAPGFCYLIEEELCATLCSGSSVTCDNLGPSKKAPCWLGEGVGCDSRWACFEENEDGGWVGACCYPDPEDPEISLLDDKAACECALLGGTFLVEPANCMSGIAPQDYPADRFISATLLAELDPEACLKPSGACCIDQDLLCLPDAPDIPLPLDMVTCMLLPQTLCESNDPKVLEALNASVPGVFTRECFPCVYDTSLFGPYSDAPPICSGFDVVREDPDNGDYTAVELLKPMNFRCAPLRITLELDAYVPDLFAIPGESDGLDAATGYATLLYAAVSDLYREEARVPLVLDELLVVANSGNELGDGACCVSQNNYEYCWESAFEDECIKLGGTWNGHGSTCYVHPCGDVPTHGGGQAPASINRMLQRLRERWTQSGACCLDGQSDSTCITLNAEDCESADGTFHASVDCGGIDCKTGDGGTTRAMIIALAAAPFLNQWVPEAGAAGGLYGPYGVIEEVGGICKPNVRFGVAPIRGGFAPSPGSNNGGNAQWDFVMLTQVMTRLLGVSMADDYGYDNCYSRYCRGMAATVDCDLYWDDPISWAFGDMASTIMSSCMSCEGGLANMQMRFRSEIAARVYATASAAPCSVNAEPTTDAVANDDIYTVMRNAPSNLDVLFNDVPVGCSADASVDPPQLFDPGEESPHALPTCTADASVGTLTEQGGHVCRDEDADDIEFIRYTPPDGFCGVDRFTYVVQDAVEGAFATVTLAARSGGSLAEQCALTYDIVCDPDCPQSDLESSEIPVPPTSGDAGVITLDAGDLAGARIEVIRWQDVQLEILVETSHVAHATMRFWFSSDADASDLDVYWDVIPYGDTLAIQCHDGPVPIGLGGSGAGLQTPVSGSCDAPGYSAFMHVPADGIVLVQCFEQLDEDNTQSDAQWVGGTLCLGGGEAAVPGACCLGGLCIEVIPAECAALGYSFDADTASWVDDSLASGFFMGSGTTCDERDWCMRDAPCCLIDDCVTVSVDNCVLLGGHPLSTDLGPLYDTPCAFNVCQVSVGGNAQGACCVTTDQGLRFCTDQPQSACVALGMFAPAGTTWTTQWEPRATCEYTACGSTHWSGEGGAGACCFPDACCTESLDQTQCGSAGGIWLETGSCSDCLTEELGVCCIGAYGPVSQGGIGGCIDGISSTVCSNALGGVWVATLEECTDGAPCSQWQAGDACCVQGICMNISPSDCALADGRYIRGASCASLDVCISGVCCVDGVNMAMEAVDEDRCVLWGGRWLQSGLCVFVGGLRAADLTGDGRVGTEDLLALIAAWGSNGGAGDLDGDGVVGLSDLLLLLSSWT